MNKLIILIIVRHTTIQYCKKNYQYESPTELGYHLFKEGTRFNCYPPVTMMIVVKMTMSHWPNVREYAA